MEKTVIPWSVPVAAEDIPETGLHIEIDAPEAVRADLAALAAVRDLPQLSAVFDLTRRGGKVHVTGQVNARVGQTCVVSLEPIENEMAEAVDLRFALAPADEVDQEIEVKSDHEPPEPLVDGKVDLGALATEFLLLGIEPYPRKVDAEFVPPKVVDDAPSPFAALEVLKKRPGGGKP